MNRHSEMLRYTIQIKGTQLQRLKIQHKSKGTDLSRGQRLSVTKATLANPGNCVCGSNTGIIIKNIHSDSIDIEQAYH